MCGRYIEVQKLEVLEKRFNVKLADDAIYKPSYNISPGKLAPVVTSDKPHELQMLQFGLTPFWAKKPMYLFNARSEGDKNKDNNPIYKGGKDIARKPAFRKPIRSQRCLVIADAFYEGTTKERLNKPYLVYLKEKQRPFAFAGIWDRWINPEDASEIYSFSIITTVANELIGKIPHHRSPVILAPNQEANWLNEKLPLADVLRMLKPFPGDKMNAYPVASSIKKTENDFPDLVKPLGERIISEYDYDISKDLRLRGMGNPKKK